MSSFFDTSVLVAASERSHPHHSPAWLALQKIVQGQDAGFMSAHSIAEVDAALTRLPVRPRIQPAEAQRIITENILPHLTVVTVEQEDYEAVLKDMGTGGVPGAKIYDALLLHCASKCGADNIYTFNLGDFKQLAAEPLQARISAP